MNAVANYVKNENEVWKLMDVNSSKKKLMDANYVKNNNYTVSSNSVMKSIFYVKMVGCI